MINADLEYLKIIKVKPLKDFMLDLVFSNGEHRLFDMKPYLNKGIFKELKNPAYFQEVSIDYGTIKWPHEQDMSPVTLYLESAR